MPDLDKVSIGISAENKELTSSLKEIIAVLREMSTTVTSVAPALKSFGTAVSALQSTTDKTATATKTIRTGVADIGKVANTSAQKTKHLYQEINKLAQSYRALGDTKTAKRVANIGRQFQLGDFDTTATAERQAGVLSLLEGSGESQAATQIRQATTEFNELDKSVKKTSSSLDKMYKAGQFAAIIVAARKLGHALAGSLKEAIDFVETMNLFNTALASNAGKATEFVNQMSAGLGLSETTLMKYVGLFYQMTTSMGLANDKAYTLSESFAKLATDMSSYYNISVSSANEKLQSALAGQIRPLRELGIDISKTALQEEARLLGITESVEKMTQAEKIQLRYAAVMRQTYNAQGDFVKQQNTAAIQIKILSEQVIVAKRAWGEVFMPVLEKVLPVINGIVIGFANMGKAISAVLGYKAKAESNLSKQLGAIDIEAEEAAESIASLNKQAMGIDELNILSDNSGQSNRFESGEWDIDIEGYDNGLKGLEKSIIGLNKVGKAFADALTWIGEQANWVLPILAALGTALAVNLSIGVIGAIVSALGKLAKAIGLVFTGSTVGIILTVTAAIVGFTMAMKNASDTRIANQVTKNLGGIKLEAEEAATVLNFMSDELDDLYVSALAAQNKLKPIQKGFAESTKASNEFWESLSTLSGDIAGQVGEVNYEVDKMTDNAKTAFKEATTIIYGSWNELFAYTNGKIEADERALLDKIRLQGTSVENAIDAIGEKIKNIYAEMASGATESVDKQIAEINRLRQVQTSLAEARFKAERQDEAATRQGTLNKILSGEVDTEQLMTEFMPAFTNSLKESIERMNEFVKDKELDISAMRIQQGILREAGFTEAEITQMGLDDETINKFVGALNNYVAEQKDVSKEGSIANQMAIFSQITDMLQGKKVDASAPVPYLDKALGTTIFGDIRKALGIDKIFSWFGSKKATEYVVDVETNKAIEKYIQDILAMQASLPGFATGGYIDSIASGGVFRAYEGGRAEAIGTVGGRMTVANVNGQIAAALGAELYPAIYRGTLDALSQGGNADGREVVIQIDGREIARATQKGTRLTGGGFSTVESGGVL